MSNASSGRSVFIEDAARQPTIILENTSIAKATYTNPAKVAT